MSRFSLPRPLLRGLLFCGAVHGLLLTSAVNAASSSQETVPSMISSQIFTSADYRSDKTYAMFPRPESSMAQHILSLAPVDNEQDYRVEVMIGKIGAADCNTRQLGGELISSTVEGWGYPFYEVKQLTAGPSTLMACPEGKTETRFIPMGGFHQFRYNSQLPMVFYIPKDATLKYRVWRAAEHFQTSSSR